MIINLRDVGKRCKEFRVKCGFLQTHVAMDLGYSTENISAFETGRNDNARILLWYLLHGMKIEQILEGGGKYGTEGADL